jgi:hypothetical protein
MESSLHLIRVTVAQPQPNALDDAQRRGVPHLLQNLAEGTFSAAHWGQRVFPSGATGACSCIRVPQPTQYSEPGTFFAPQPGQLAETTPPVTLLLTPELLRMSLTVLLLGPQLLI